MILGQGLRIITTLLGGGVSNDGIDKVDNGGGGSPMQVCKLNWTFEGESDECGEFGECGEYGELRKWCVLGLL